MLKGLEATKPSRLEDVRKSQAVPAYTTQAGWPGFSGERMIELVQKNLDNGMDKFKLKVGADIEDDRCRLKIFSR